MSDELERDKDEKIENVEKGERANKILQGMKRQGEGEGADRGRHKMLVLYEDMQGDIQFYWTRLLAGQMKDIELNSSPVTFLMVTGDSNKVSMHKTTLQLSILKRFYCSL